MTVIRNAIILDPVSWAFLPNNSTFFTSLAVQGLKDEVLNFGQIYSVNPKYITQALNICRTLQNAINPQNLYFNLDRAKAIIQQHSSLSFAGIIDQSLTQSSANADLMIENIAKTLKNYLNVVLTSDEISHYKNIVVQAFNNLTFKQEEAWIFWSRTDGHKTTYQYNTFFALNDQLVENEMFVFALGSTITVNIETERVLCDQVKNIHEYSVLLQGIKMRCPVLGGI